MIETTELACSGNDFISSDNIILGPMENKSMTFSELILPIFYL